jgi:hypothetical protein
MKPGPTSVPGYPLPMRPEGITARAAAVPAVVVLVFAVVVGTLLARPAAAQEGGGTDTTVAPGADATAPPATAETPTTLADLDTPEAPVREAPLTESEKASRTIDWVVRGLLLLAVIVLGATIALWRRSTPSRLMAEEMAGTERQRDLGLSPVATAEASWSQPQPQPGAPSWPDAPQSQPVAPPLQPGDPAPAAAVPTPPRPLPTAPGSWGAFAAAAGLDPSEDPGRPGAGPSPQQPAEVGQPGVEQLPTEVHQVLPPPEAPRPAFETASAGTWASQGWGEQGGDAPPVLPRGFVGSGTREGSWRWNERAGQGQVAAGSQAPDPGDGGGDGPEAGGDEAGGDEADRGDPPGEGSGPL